MYYNNAFRINLKPDSEDRRELIYFCLKGKQQYEQLDGVIFISSQVLK